MQRLSSLRIGPFSHEMRYMCTFKYNHATSLLCLYNFCLISTDDKKREQYRKYTAATIQENQ